MLEILLSGGIVFMSTQTVQKKKKIERQSDIIGLMLKVDL